MTRCQAQQEANAKAAYFATLPHMMPTWFHGGDAVDTKITEAFRDDLNQLEANESEFEARVIAPDNIRNTLAVVILADQMSRNIYRGTAKSFAFDAYARNKALTLIASKEDKKLRPIERSFLYMPLEHSEDIEHHRLHLTLLSEMQAECVEQVGEDAPIVEMIGGFKQYLEDHTKVIERFGRYPHRNRVLGRESTPEELEYLKAADTWGQ